MSKERELLQKVLAFLETDVENDFGFGSDIKKLLAQPERKSFSDDEITTNTPKTIPIGERLAFHAGIRWAEHQHGITGVDDE